MCLLCLQDFEFVLPVKTLPEKKKRAGRIKILLNAADCLMAINYPVCQEKYDSLKEEQYKLSREL